MPPGRFLFCEYNSILRTAAGSLEGAVADDIQPKISRENHVRVHLSREKKTLPRKLKRYFRRCDALFYIRIFYVRKGDTAGCDIFTSGGENEGATVVNVPKLNFFSFKNKRFVDHRQLFLIKHTVF